MLTLCSLLASILYNTANSPSLHTFPRYHHSQVVLHLSLSLTHSRKNNVNFHSSTFPRSSKENIDKHIDSLPPFIYKQIQQQQPQTLVNNNHIDNDNRLPNNTLEPGKNQKKTLSDSRFTLSRGFTVMPITRGKITIQ